MLPTRPPIGEPVLDEVSESLLRARSGTAVHPAATYS